MSQRKRRHQTAAEEEEEETVDDLAVAASFAMAGLAGMGGGNQEEEDTSSDDDDEESSDDDDEEEDESSEDEKAEGKDADDTYANDEEEKTAEELPAKDSSANDVNGNDEVKEESDSDDESDVDLSEALARMVGESGDEAGASDDEGANGGGGRRRGARGSGRRGKPKADASSTAPLRTENEIDPYACDVSVLEEKLAIDLRVDTTAGQANGTSAQNHSTQAAAGRGGGNDVQLCPAGRVKNHLVKERTIVVESGLGMVTFASGPLDEGSLLVVRAGTSTTTGSSSGAEAPEADSGTTIIPLGRVFEVF